MITVQRSPFLLGEVYAESCGRCFLRIARRFDQSHLYLSGVEQIVDFQTSGHFGELLLSIQ